MIVKLKTQGSVETYPDYMELSFHLSNTDELRVQAVQNVAAYYREVEAFVRNYVSDSVSMKTSHYSLTAEYDYTHDNTNNYHRVFKGYRCSQHLTLRVLIQTDIAFQCITTLTKADDVQVNVRYYVKDTSAFEDTCVRQALKKAEDEARNIFDALDYKKCTCIEVNFRDNETYDNSVHYAGAEVLCMSDTTGNMNEYKGVSETISPKAIVISKTVYTTWESVK